MEPVIVIGAGLAGSEAAWQLAKHGIPVGGVVGAVVRTTLICLAVMFITYLLAVDKGYPTVLLIITEEALQKIY